MMDNPYYSTTSSTMNSVKLQAARGPGFFGILLSLAFGQLIYYFRSFPNDRRPLKLIIGVMFILDCAHFIGLLGTFWHALVMCRRVASSSGCEAPYGWQSMTAFVGTYFLYQAAQSFYVHRVWIISGRNKLVTGILLSAALSQILLGFVSVRVAVKSGDWQTMYNSPYPAFTASMSLICDLLITTSIAYYLRSRSKMYKQENYIHQLKITFLGMGLLSCVFSVFVVVTFSLPSLKARLDWVPAPGPVLTQIYFNSVLTVLNARKAIRRRHVAALGQMYGIRTLPTNTLSHA